MLVSTLSGIKLYCITYCDERDLNIIEWIINQYLNIVECILTVIWKTRTPDNADTDTDNMLTLILTLTVTQPLPLTLTLL